jgi:hypothetical protein
MVNRALLPNEYEAAQRLVSIGALVFAPFSGFDFMGALRWFPKLRILIVASAEVFFWGFTSPLRLASAVAFPTHTPNVSKNEGDCVPIPS